MNIVTEALHLSSEIHRFDERAYVGASKKAWDSLSWEAQDLIRSWETSQWVGGPLEKAIKSNNHLAQEIEAAFAQVRKVLGSRVKLFRGIQFDKGYKGGDKFLESWTDDRKVAEHFAGLRDPSFVTLLYDEVADDEIKKVVDAYRRTGFATWRTYKFKRNKDLPEYYNIYRGSEFITDGDDLLSWLKDQQQLAKKRNDEKRKNGKVLEEDIETSRIVWFTNNLNSKEFIIRKRR